MKLVENIRNGARISHKFYIKKEDLSLMKDDMYIECCANCKNCLDYPRGNKYGDVDHLCIVDGYFVMGVHKDRTKVKGYSPGGRELQCKYERKTDG